MKFTSASITLLILIFASTDATQCVTELDSGDNNYKIFNNKKAYDFYSKALTTCPDYESLMKTTRALIDIGEDINGKRGVTYFTKALAYTDSLQRKYPDSLQSYFLKAAAAGNLTKYKGGKARVELARIIESNVKKALSIDSSFAPAHVVLGVYYRQVATIGKFTKKIAKSIYGKIPDGTLKDSERELTKAVIFDNQNIFAHYELGQTYYLLGKAKEAKEQLQIVLTLPNNNNQSEQIKKSAKKMLKKW